MGLRAMSNSPGERDWPSEAWARPMVGPPFIAVIPSSSSSFAASPARSRGMYVPYTGIFALTAPPSISYTGSPAAWPLMSHRAMSRHDIARISAPPYPAWSDSRNMASQCLSTANGSRPISNGPNQSWTAASTTDGA